MNQLERMLQYRLGRLLNISQSPDLDPWLLQWESAKICKIYRQLAVAQALAAQEVSA